MRHQISGKKLGRSAPQRSSLRRTMLNQLIQHERIKTTKAKAQFVRSDFEKLITLAKRGLKASADIGEAETPEAKAAEARYVHAHREAQRKLNNPDSVRKLFETVAPRYEKRPGGYTRILKLGLRQGDAADMVLLELVEE
jgi:large subunit ribosomal protein L17